MSRADCLQLATLLERLIQAWARATPVEDHAGSAYLLGVLPWLRHPRRSVHLGAYEAAIRFLHEDTLLVLVATSAEALPADHPERAILLRLAEDLDRLARGPR